MGTYVIAGESAGTNPEKPRADLQRPWYTVSKRAGLNGVRLHDLRHTHASFGAGAGFGLPIIGKLLGHVQASTTQRYAHLDIDPLRRASEHIARKLAAAMGECPTETTHSSVTPSFGMARSKRVPTGWIRPERDVEPTLVQWKGLEDLLNYKASAKVRKRKLNQKVRTQIWTCCFLFAKHGPATIGTIPVTKAIAKITQWRAKTISLRGRLWRKRGAKDSPEHPLTVKKIYLMPLFARKKDDWQALNFFAEVLDVAIASGKLSIQDIQDPQFAGSREKELWFVWVALLRKVISHAGFYTSAASGHKSATDSPFVKTVQELQTWLPADCRKRKTTASIAKGIQDAARKYGDLKTMDLVELLFYWGTGWTDSSILQKARTAFRTPNSKHSA